MMTNTPENSVSEVCEAMSSQDMQRLLALYEQDATFVTDTGETLRGLAAVEEAMQTYFAIKPTMTVTRVNKSVVADNIAFVACDWRMTGTEPGGNPVELNGTTADVLRKQPDGAWLFLIDNPFGVA